MKAVFCTKVGKLNDQDPDKRGTVGVLESPEKPLGSGEVRIKIAYCGICGTDPHNVAGIFGRQPPFALGHELSGIIVEVGPDISTGLKVGDRVGGNFRRLCGTCYECVNGKEQFCRQGKPGDSGMAESIVWHEKQVVHIPKNVSLLEGALLEPTSVAVRAIDKASIKFGTNVLVSGGGPIGLLTLQAAAMSGAANLTLSEPIADRRELAKRFGAKYTLDPLKDDLEAATAEITDGRGFDYILEASGIASAATAMLPLATTQGSIVFIAQYPRDYDMPLNAYKYLYERELNITGQLMSPYTFARTANILERFDLEPFTRAVYDIDDVQEAFDAHMTGKYPKVLIRCNPGMDDL